ncbi:ADP-ribosylation/Crystallin J1 [Thecamonas trahens ATCC 50062]|uniref:ADP-ribosylation/Crystallin J1 n=1 Tax=Thecamonas trahens ATCC 50062 TaxID=461836 RepID=A0A0L0DHM4_THETB|nr:ADP-ribosylation/Crystallin J1 [Thecamonas trahens ATCC 50062]KNC51874.1 ADP-ribosylation/Crystallin J1 [Thecamonas trahens ATCC 50062]|eukprot:XP_013755733.1 ADP-ribosylation/Crystallin J1 [Thecamonas trahens ATCC 50062]
MAARSPAHAAVLGALIGDAAAIGSHWIYGAGNVAARLGPSPAFAAPDKANYEPPAYYAHGTKSVGESTHLGHATVVALAALATAPPSAPLVPGPGPWRAAFLAAYDYGGAWVGYIDSATRGTMANIKAAVDSAVVAAVPDADPAQAAALAKAANSIGGAAALSLGTPEYLPALRKALADTKVTAPGDDALEAFSTALAAPIGDGNDTQTNALCKVLPYVLAVDAGLARDDVLALVADAIAETQNNSVSQLAITNLFTILLDVVSGTSIADAVAAGLAGLDAAVDAGTPHAAEYAKYAHLAVTLAADGVDDCVAVADEHFGSACPLEFTLPCLYHALSVASDYHDAVNRALLVGGDSAARTAYLGAPHLAAPGNGR